MAPPGAARGYARPGLDPKATVMLFLSALLLTLSCTHGLPIRTEKLSAEDAYHMNGDIRCLRCFPGEFLKTACTVQDSRGECEPCPHGTYSEHPTGMPECIRCTRCRDDQEEVTSCSATKNTLCRCKKGTFCPPGHPCEICMPCTTSCPEDHIVQAPCNSTSDTQCGPPDQSTHTSGTIITCVVLLVVLIIIIVCVVIYVKKKKNTGPGSRLIKQLTVFFCKTEKNGEQDTDTQLLPRPSLEIKGGISADERDEIISKSSVIFVDQIPPKNFEKFMLKLGLRGNDIQRAKMDNQDAEGQNHAMLRMWYLQKNFDVNQLLETLHSLNMGKVADDIRDQLIRDALYIERTSS